ncbi:hypothetical protein C5167_010020 [Papaver somniferum]|uniref:Helicase ATP-binding domain-containing protein n=1 Tax=Papaver somniferum TaxID=3469 RepID=A0A4Y7K238_PAPSO|nr:hypothetical protein C5167_010020 [Papaver somniferum]
MGSLKRKPEGNHWVEELSDAQKKQKSLIGEDISAVAACIHEVSYPKGYTPPLRRCNNSNRKPAKEYPFSLDSFQSEAIKCLDNGESVMVSAHTSAGKTVVAQYAIAMSLRDKQRVIYTAPIKALSNQKYREFKEEFSDVGLMTGDVTIEPNASCLVMTTEIWRSMQYKGSEIMREVAWVIFDEVHYMRDRERGVVWEESIVMAPKNSRFVFLSATVPNAKEFADWVAKVHRQPRHVVYTDYRPTPLQHYVFPSGGEGLNLVVDEKGKFLEDSFQKALNAVPLDGEGDNKKKRIGNGRQMIIVRQYDPVIVFSFSKRDCESLAMMVSNMLPLLKRGIGVHHSGLLPILKEVIEILFQEGLIKCLFATETFSIGLNMPAKTVVFTNVRKFDGDKFRWISGGEYIQMSGRAGRRGIDKRGICILMVDEKLEPSTVKTMLRGSADCLNSAFHLSYNMLLNQMRHGDGNPEDLLKNSFYLFQSDHAIPDLMSQAKKLKEEKDLIMIDEEETLMNYYYLLEQRQKLKKDINDIVFCPKYCVPFLKSGRLISIRCTRGDNNPSFSIEDQVTWGVITNFGGVIGLSEDDSRGKAEDANCKVHVLTRCVVSKDGGTSIKIVPSEEQGEPVVVSVPLSQAKFSIIHFCSFLVIWCFLVIFYEKEYNQYKYQKICLCTGIDGLSSRCLNVPKDLLPLTARENTFKMVCECVHRDAEESHLLDPVEDMKVQHKYYNKFVSRLEKLESQFSKHEVVKSPLIKEKLKALRLKKELEAKIMLIRNNVSSSKAFAFKDELKARMRVLRNLKYVTRAGVVELKGKVACEITGADELTLTELMFKGVFNRVTVEEMISLLSCFVWQEKLQDAQKPREGLDLLFTELQETAKTVANVQLNCKVPVDIEGFVNSFRPDIMEVVYAWAKGSKFCEIMEIAQVFEGSLIRAIRRLEEVLQQLTEAAKSLGDTQLEAKFQEAVTKIKRDIVFAASLYL